MTRTVRHEGSPRAIEKGSPWNRFYEGLLDGLREPTDEVRRSQGNGLAGPGKPSGDGVETAGEVEPPPPRIADEATNLDFNALIDVCLVLLIFFILTTTYAALIKQLLDMPSSTPIGSWRDRPTSSRSR